MTALDTFLNGLMQRYQARVPAVERILDIMQESGVIADHSDVENDHIAFRTMGVPHLGIGSLEKIFLANGFERRDAYSFATKKLDAYWYAPPQPQYPRVFISELRVGELSTEAQKIISSYTQEVTSDPVDAIDLSSGDAIDEFLHRPLWRTPTLSDYLRLAEESEYAAWVIYNRYYLNHFTISVHNLPAPHNDIYQFNEMLEKHGIRLNDAGGKVKVSPDGLLLQSSSVAEMVEASFEDDQGQMVQHAIAGSYIEFAQREVLPAFQGLPADQIGREHRREGFEAGNADKIFESTFSTQTKRTT